MPRPPLSSMQVNAIDVGKDVTPVKKPQRSIPTKLPMPPLPSPTQRARSSPPPPQAPSPKPASGLAADLARSALYQRMRRQCCTPPTLHGAESPEALVYETRENAATQAGSITEVDAANKAPAWQTTPARKLREEADKLRNMSRLNSPSMNVVAQETRFMDSRFAMAAELADTRARLESAEKQLQTSTAAMTPIYSGGSGAILTESPAVAASSLMSRSQPMFDIESPGMAKYTALVGQAIPKSHRKHFAAGTPGGIQQLTPAGALAGVAPTLTPGTAGAIVVGELQTTIRSQQSEILGLQQQLECAKQETETFRVALEAEQNQRVAV